MTNQRILSSIGKFLKDMVTKNIAMKLIAFLFAVLLWGYVLTVENPEYEKTIQDVNITVLGADSLNAKDLMLVTRELGTTDVSVLCEVSKHSELNASKVTCAVNLTNKNFTLAEDEDSKVFTVDVTTSLASGYGTITSVERSSVDIEIARLSTRARIPVSVEFVGELPEGFFATAQEMLWISVSGMKSQVDEIAKASVTIDLESFPGLDPYTLTGEYDQVCDVEFYNSGNVRLEDITTADGKAITLDVPVSIRCSKTVPIRPSIEMLNGSGFSYSYVLSRETVVLYGDPALLETIDHILTETITVEPAVANTLTTATLLIPEGISLDPGTTSKITVTVSVTEDVETREFTVPLTVQNLERNLKLGEDMPLEVTLIVRGTKSQLDHFMASDVTVYLDMTGLGIGTYSVPVRVEWTDHFEGMTAVCKETTVSVILLAN